MPCRTIAIGDIHGCLTALDGLLDAIRPGPEDLIVALGDYINRGPDSRGVLDRLIALGRRYRLVPLLGNHDQMLLDALAGRSGSEFFEKGGRATLDSYGIGGDLGRIPDEHVAFLQGCRDYHETDSHIFVHANYEADLPMDEQPRYSLRWESLRDWLPGPHRSGKPVIAGHTSQKSGEILDLGHVKCIDTYCHGGGWLTALDVDTGQIWQADNRGGLRR